MQILTLVVLKFFLAWGDGLLSNMRTHSVTWNNTSVPSKWHLIPFENNLCIITCVSQI